MKPVTSNNAFENQHNFLKCEVIFGKITDVFGFEYFIGKKNNGMIVVPCIIITPIYPTLLEKVAQDFCFGNRVLLITTVTPNPLFAKSTKKSIVLISISDLINILFSIKN
ncbi:hypothetical protein SOV_09450 [Sporomusa ovata DSM 2662]|uniref:hypothetical protein n=1 Tax=Sporomusa ovata TaxID=2378 RepID=UPI000388240D|nr:hypothetical protein [Sporomusa ovata]EQB28594.1 hypothetical protein SOV_1c02830 [Sporomusa ovata DSM 2662]